MALFDVDFVFSCPCFVSDIQQALFKSTKNYEIAGIVSGKHVVKNLGIDYFKEDISIFICYYGHLLGGMLFDTQSYLHYNTRVFLKCLTKVLCIRLKNVFNVIEEVLEGF